MLEYLIQLFSQPEAWLALGTLVVMEVVLGIDNLVFISILTNRLPESRQSSARRVGIAGALLLRLGLLATVAFIVRLTDPVLTVLGNEFSWRDFILMAGGLFLVWKATKEIHHNVDPDLSEDEDLDRVGPTYLAVVGQILLLDLVFSLDSIITAVGMTDHIPVMVIAVVVAVAVMLLAADPLATFIHNNPSVVMLALGFLLLIGTTLLAEAFDVHVPKGYIYSAMLFSGIVEGLNLMAARRRKLKAQHARKI